MPESLEALRTALQSCIAATKAPTPQPADFSVPWDFNDVNLAFPTNTVAAMPATKRVDERMHLRASGSCSTTGFTSASRS